MRAWRDGLPAAEAERLATIMDRAFTERERGWTAAEIADLSHQQGVAVIAEPDGFGMVRTVADEAEILTLAVDPAARGHGLGERLVAAMLDAARADGAVRIMLEVAASNTAAGRVYGRAGFAQVARRQGYFHRADGRREDALVLTLALADPLARTRHRD